MEFGLNTIVGESGFTISGGQRQRLAILELYRKTKILVMDEATSSLDEQIESNLIKSMRTTMNITLIMIAHKFQR